MIRRYSELIRLPTFEERFKYLKLNGQVGYETFGYDRYLNQKFYKSPEWKHVRDIIIVRDMGCDLGDKDHPISDHILIHHMNPVSIEDLETNPGILLDPEFLICVSHETHNAIHFGDDSILDKHKIIDRSPNDTIPWRK
jgi:hypothetical protein